MTILTGTYQEQNLFTTLSPGLMDGPGTALLAPFPLGSNISANVLLVTHASPITSRDFFLPLLL